MILPFVALLGMIALGPLWFGEWWGKHYPKVSFGLGAITLAYYFFALPPKASVTVLHTAHEYFSFIVLIGSLYIVSGGIHINVKGEATPLANVVFLMIGAVIANLLGTTGASMLLIRPWLRMNKYRVTAYHVVFFIFIVSNVGGCLTPIGDPPLFLGYLKGIPFWWVAEHCWPMWLMGVGMLLAIFYALDLRNYLRAPKAVRAELAEPRDQWRFEGLPNLFFLAVILIGVFVSSPMFLREALMIAAALGSYFTTARKVHEANHFGFHPIQEVTILFAGIFATMIPALDWLQTNASQFGEATPTLYYWSAGTLSSVLDNAPTYLSFLSAAFGTFVPPDVVGQVQQALAQSPMDLAAVAEPIRNCIDGLQKYFPGAMASHSASLEQIEIAYLLGNLNLNQFIVAISVAAVFFGANTYIGNGPNFLVKSIADHQKIHTPGFLGYIFKYTLPFMLPVLILVWLIFFR
jgi:Na+/H+ antiporter NhaD/arsenite permease-like protein